MMKWRKIEDEMPSEDIGRFLVYQKGGVPFIAGFRIPPILKDIPGQEKEVYVDGYGGMGHVSGMISIFTHWMPIIPPEEES